MQSFIPTGPGLKVGLPTGQDTASARIPADFDNFVLKADAEELHLPVILRHQQNP